MTNYFVVIYSHIVHFWLCIFFSALNGFCMVMFGLLLFHVWCWPLHIPIVYEWEMGVYVKTLHRNFNAISECSTLTFKIVIYKYAVKCTVKCIQIAPHVYSTLAILYETDEPFSVKLNWYIVIIFFFVLSKREREHGSKTVFSWLEINWINLFHSMKSIVCHTLDGKVVVIIVFVVVVVLASFQCDVLTSKW